MEDMGASLRDRAGRASPRAPTGLGHPATIASAEDFLAKVATLADDFGWQAGVGGMETAGALISYLARFPEKLPAFMADNFDLIGDFPPDWCVQGCLTWHARDGKVMRPEFVRRAKIIKDMERQPE